MQVSPGESYRFAKHLIPICHFLFLPSIILMISLFALSTADVSSDWRYISVVLSESCPIALLIVNSDTLFECAMLAHAWRAT